MENKTNVWMEYYQISQGSFVYRTACDYREKVITLIWLIGKEKDHL